MAKNEFSLEKKIKQLEELEKYFQGTEIDLEKGLAKHREALTISREIMEYLKTAKTTLEEIENNS